MEDASLNEFVESDESEAGSADPDEVTGVEPAAATAQWSPAGESCERCEAATNRLWMDDGAFVCQSCKDW